MDDVTMEADEAFAPAAQARRLEQNKPIGDRDGAEKEVSHRPPKKQRAVTDKAKEPLPPNSYLRPFKEADWSHLEVKVICDVDAATKRPSFGIVSESLRPVGSSADGGFDLPDERDELIKCMMKNRLEIYCEPEWYKATIKGVSLPSEDSKKEAEQAEQAAEVEQLVHKLPKKNPETLAQNPKKAAMDRRHEHIKTARYLSHLDDLKARFGNSYHEFEAAFKSEGKEIRFRPPERVVSATGYAGVCKNRSGGGFGHRINDARITTSLLTGEVMTTAKEAAEQLAIITACGELWQQQVLNGEDHANDEQPAAQAEDDASSSSSSSASSSTSSSASFE